MSNKMSLTINNLGPINHADLEIARINVVVGKNSTGKSTSSKILFSLLTAASNEGNNLANNDIKVRFVNLLRYWTGKLYNEKNILYNTEEILIQPLENESLNNELFEKTFSETKKLFEDLNFNGKDAFFKDLKAIHELILLNENVSLKYWNVLHALVQSEYGSSLDNFSNSQIKICGEYDNKKFMQNIPLDRHKREEKITGDFLEFFNYENVIYIDSPSIFEINVRNKNNAPYHLKVLERKLKKIKDNADIYGDDYYGDLNNFKMKIDDLIDGEFKYSIENNKFVFSKDNQNYSMESTASGLKQLGILQLLLDNNELTKNSFLILDEPEINLHPEFQVKLAEILVLAVKDLNIDLYINTHSPFFAESIEAYSRLYDLDDCTNFYLTDNAQNDKFDYHLMNNEDILEVYDNLGNPFDEIRKINLKADLKKNIVFTNND